MRKFLRKFNVNYIEICLCIISVGHINVSSVPLNITHEDVLKLVSPLTHDGGWQPEDCTSKYLVGIIIPYRDRQLHLLQLLYYLHPLLKRQQLNYKIFVVEQVRIFYHFGISTY